MTTKNLIEKVKESGPDSSIFGEGFNWKYGKPMVRGKSVAACKVKLWFNNMAYSWKDSSSHYAYEVLTIKKALEAKRFIDSLSTDELEVLKIACK